MTVVRALMERLPFEHIVYFGDTARRVPYGIKSVETINRYATQITEFLLQQDVNLLILIASTKPVPVSGDRFLFQENVPR